MDLRKMKIRTAIREAFIQLRRDKNLEQITVKELSEMAQISKATFYLHYRDITICLSSFSRRRSSVCWHM